MTYVRGASIVLDGLVLALDAGNDKSFRGEPTTNYVNSNGYNYNPLDLYTWSQNGSTSTWSRDSSITSPVGGIPVKEISSGTDSYSNTYNSIPYNLCSVDVGQIWTISVYAKSTAGTNLQLWFFESNSSGNHVLADAISIAATGYWQRLVFTRTITTGSFIQARVATATDGATIWWDGLQVEQKDHASTFVSGNRGFTVATNGGWKDLSGLENHGVIQNYPIINNGGLVFDGVDDYILVNNLNPSNFSCDVWFKGVSGYVVRKTSYGWGIYLSDGINTWVDTDLNYRITTQTQPYISNELVNIHITFGESIFTVYKNGEYISSITTATNTVYSGNGDLNIASDNGSVGCLDGTIYLIKIYNRALSSDEIKQNYNANKSRFNLE